MNTIRKAFGKPKIVARKPLSLELEPRDKGVYYNAPPMPPLPTRAKLPDEDTLVKETLAMYTSYEGTRTRVIEFFRTHSDKKARIDCLKHEYNNSGGTTYYGFVDFNTQGMLVTIKPDKNSQHRYIHLTWSDVAKAIEVLIAEKKYYSPLYQ